MKVRFLSNTNIRISTRDFSLPLLGVIFAGTELDVDDRLYRGKDLEGINTYFRDERGWYYWSGRVAIIYKAISAPSFEKMPPPENQERIGGDWNIRLEEPEVPGKQLAEQTLEKSDTKNILSNTLIHSPVLSKPVSSAPQIRESPVPIIVQTSEYADPYFHYNQELINWGIEKNQLQKWWSQDQVIGKGVRVAILDTGIDADHPDLAQAIFQSYNFCSPDSRDIWDKDGRGSLCAGLLAGQGQQHYLGVAPGASLWIAKVMEHSLGLQVDRVWHALDWIFSFPIDIILFGFDLRIETLTREQRTRFQTYINQAFSKGIVLIAPNGESTGNRPEDRFPAAYPEVLSIGGHDQQGQRLSNGVRSYSLNLLAPGIDLFSAEISPDLVGASAYSASFSAGVLALAMEFAQKNHLQYSASNWMDLLKDTAKAKFELTKCKDIEYGCGRLDSSALLEVLRAAVGKHTTDGENEKR